MDLRIPKDLGTFLLHFCAIGIFAATGKKAAAEHLLKAQGNLHFKPAPSSLYRNNISYE
jgi:hypothetical protein